MKIVIVQWDDTFADVGWSNNELNPISIASVGVIIQEDDKKVVLAGMVGTAGLEDYNCRQAIPRGCIKRIRYLKVEKEG